MRLTWCGRAIAAGWLSVALCGSALAEEGRRNSWKKRWIVSVAAMAAASFADAYTSRGRMEMNPLLRNSAGRFSTGRAAALKAGSVGGTLLVESLLARRSPEVYRSATVMNFCTTAVFTAVAVRNAAVPKAAVAK